MGPVKGSNSSDNIVTTLHYVIVDKPKTTRQKCSLAGTQAIVDIVSLVEILALASSTNPKTSALTRHSLVLAVCDGMSFRALDLLRAER
jgi:hypothetical protein